ncbi:MAG TPA: 3-oxoacyl-ACP reductase family protein [Tepidisphaeraceae bacterium]|nr:3-oxoacyl-ACP reductase family protein [Tepidisphaeraceae bacterium]
MADSTEQVLKGKVALLTGAARGIGAASARQLAKMGATVLVNYLTSKAPAQKVVDQIRKEGGNAHALMGNVSDPAAVDALFTMIDQLHGGRIDILVNNAAVFQIVPTTEMTFEDFQKTISVNLSAVFLVTKQAVQRMPDGGRIINIGSAIGERAMFRNAAAYSASKFAVVGLTKSWAREFGPRGITANVIQPGPIDTEMNPGDPAINPAAEKLRSAVPLSRYGSTDEVANLVGFLASPAAAFVNGARILIDGGWTA